ncbi:MAG: GNAT family N-acetyltransferase [Anaerolineae bacterium]|jgi:diamine N-acetyltransferase|nr:GNAT family N-acetyltransferase [Anaerolineae bacterium]
MTITLQPITKDNWEIAIRLKVSDDQKHFVASNLYSIAEASFYPTAITNGIYEDDTMIGFTLYGYNDEADQQGYWIVRLMIDQAHQGKGYGRAAMRLIIDALHQKPDCEQIFISFEPENDVARKLYASLGFVDDGRMIEGEVVYRLDLHS